MHPNDFIVDTFSEYRHRSRLTAHERRVVNEDELTSFGQRLFNRSHATLLYSLPVGSVISRIWYETPLMERPELTEENMLNTQIEYIYWQLLGSRNSDKHLQVKGNVDVQVGALRLLSGNGSKFLTLNCFCRQTGRCFKMLCSVRRRRRGVRVLRTGS